MTDEERAKRVVAILAAGPLPEPGGDNPTVEQIRKVNAIYPLSVITTLLAELDRVTAERDEAILHDRQPYPTAWAYEKACAARDAAIARADEAEGWAADAVSQKDAALAQVKRLRKALDELVECADAFGLELPEGEYKGLGNLRFAIRAARADLAATEQKP